LSKLKIKFSKKTLHKIYVRFITINKKLRDIYYIYIRKIK